MLSFHPSGAEALLYSSVNPSCLLAMVCARILHGRLSTRPACIREKVHSWLSSTRKQYKYYYYERLHKALVFKRIGLLFVYWLPFGTTSVQKHTLTISENGIYTTIVIGQATQEHIIAAQTVVYTRFEMPTKSMELHSKTEQVPEKRLQNADGVIPSKNM